MNRNGSAVSVFLFMVSFILTARFQWIAASSRDSSNFQQKKPGEKNFQPIIGIISQAVKGAPLSEIEVSYVKFIEMGGGRAAPIRLDASFHDIKHIFDRINGLLYPGGDTPLLSHGRFFEIETYLFNLAIAANDRGDFFPIWGTCLGFEALAQIVTKNDSFIHPLNFDDINVIHPLIWNRNLDVIRSSRLLNLCGTSGKSYEDNEESQLNRWNLADNTRLNFRRELVSVDPVEYIKKFESPVEGNFMCNPTIYEAASVLPLAAYYHEDGVSMKEWHQKSELNNFFHLLASSISTKGVEFIAMVEAKRYPIYGVQFHPEKNLYAFSPLINATHGLIASQFSQYFSTFFINEARKSHHRFPDYDTEYEYLIYKHTPTNRLRSEHQYDFSQVYQFPYNE
ncbi:gamma-glutamyl hydrolase [Cardiosporidium cionae]|uniref:folate gamma-glutamyl hydrolase n=1 Tax=Cardiosporidium cionae TaxID=476202 RepID=A0ABQ7JFM3_9APIC|nr:gamma-glutamyl hydrolase [Cardiosporidium cionae]|eukprot:KAF8822789.1 gamma-glutamyl hydrolase [Cardiosporidium cionae]